MASLTKCSTIARVFISALVILSVTAGSPMCIGQQYTFSPQQHLPGRAGSLVIADFNSDGLNDLVTASLGYSDHRLFIYAQQHDTLAAADSMSYNSISNWALTSIAAGDMNGDGRNDLVVSYSDTVKIFFQDTVNGFFDPLHHLVIASDSGALVRGLACGDLNNDGLADLAFTHWADTQLKVYYQTGSHTFTLQPYFKRISSRNDLIIADMDNDGLEDLVVSAGNTISSFVTDANRFTFAIYRQDPATHLLRSPLFFARDTTTANMWIANYAQGIEVGDITGDGLKDVVTTNMQEVYIWRQVAADPQLFPNPPEQISGPMNPSSVRIADFDNDGKNEFAVAGAGYSQISVYMADQNFDFGAFKSYPTWTQNNMDQYTFATGDLNNDGRTDAVTCYGSGVSILYNDTASGTSGIPRLHLQTALLFPNPASGVFSVRSLPGGEEQQLYIHGTDGRLLFSRTIAGGITTIKAGLLPGTYIITIKGKEKTVKDMLIMEPEK